MTQHLAKTLRGLRIFETCSLIEIRNPLVLSDVSSEVVVVVAAVYFQTESWSTQKSIRPNICPISSSRILEFSSFSVPKCQKELDRCRVPRFRNQLAIENLGQVPTYTPGKPT